MPPAIIAPLLTGEPGSLKISSADFFPFFFSAHICSSKSFFIDRFALTRLNILSSHSSKSNSSSKIQSMVFNCSKNFSLVVQPKPIGFSDINNISLKIDDIPILFEYNSYQKKIFYFFEELLTIGQHKLEIEVKDNVGNTTYKKGIFTIQ